MANDVIDLTNEDEPNNRTFHNAWTNSHLQESDRVSRTGQSLHQPIDLTDDGLVPPSRGLNLTNSTANAVEEHNGPLHSGGRAQPNVASPSQSDFQTVDRSPQRQKQSSPSSVSAPGGRGDPPRAVAPPNRSNMKSRAEPRTLSKLLISSDNSNMGEPLSNGEGSKQPQPREWTSDQMTDPGQNDGPGNNGRSSNVTDAQSTTPNDISQLDPLSYAYVAILWARCRKELQSDYEHHVRVSLKRSRVTFNRNFKQQAWTQRAVPDHLIDTLDFFKGIPPIEISVGEIPTTSARNSKARDRTKDEADFTQLIKPTTGYTKAKQVFKITEIGYQSDTAGLPAYLSHTTLPNSIIAENNRKFLTVPRTASTDEGNQELLDRVDDDGGRAYLTEHGWSDLASNRFNNFEQKHRAWKFGTYVHDFLEEVGSNENAALDFILDTEYPDRSLAKQARNLIPQDDRRYFDQREKFLEMQKVQTEKTWKELRRRLTEPSPKELAAAAMACAAFFDSENFSLWEVVHYGSHAKKILSQIAQNRHSQLSPQDIFKEDFQYRDLACKVCHLHACPFHGQMLEVLGDRLVDIVDDELVPRSTYNSKKSAALIEYEASNNNIRKPVTGVQHGDDQPGSIVNRSFHTKYWTVESGAWKIKERHTFFPCDHEGSCKDARCRCFKQGIPCEKLCGCSKLCRRRFPGCDCSRKGNKTCIGKDTCLCNILRRECDPDLCGKCGVVEVLNPVNRKRQDNAWLESHCKNCYIQRGVAKKTWLAESEVENAGFGLFAGVDIKKDEFIGEYKGENISATELKRREIVDDRTYYLFDLCEDTTTDAGTKGNKIRFVNNSSQHDNCVAQNMLCNMHVRIGLYALRDIKAEEEIYFNYNWPEHVRQHLEFGERNGQREKAPKSTGSKKGRKSRDTEKKPFGKPIITGASKRTHEERDSPSSTSSSERLELTRAELTTANLSQHVSALSNDENEEIMESEPEGVEYEEGDSDDDEDMEEVEDSAESDSADDDDDESMSS